MFFNGKLIPLLSIIKHSQALLTIINQYEVLSTITDQLKPTIHPSVSRAIACRRVAFSCHCLSWMDTLNPILAHHGAGIVTNICPKVQNHLVLKVYQHHGELIWECWDTHISSYFPYNSRGDEKEPRHVFINMFRIFKGFMMIFAHLRQPTLQSLCILLRLRFDAPNFGQQSRQKFPNSPNGKHKKHRCQHIFVRIQAIHEKTIFSC